MLTTKTIRIEQLASSIDRVRSPHGTRINPRRSRIELQRILDDIEELRCAGQQRLTEGPSETEASQIASVLKHCANAVASPVISDVMQTMKAQSQTGDLELFDQGKRLRSSVVKELAAVDLDTRFARVSARLKKLGNRSTCMVVGEARDNPDSDNALLLAQYDRFFPGVFRQTNPAYPTIGEPNRTLAAEEMFDDGIESGSGFIMLSARAMPEVMARYDVDSSPDGLANMLRSSSLIRGLSGQNGIAEEIIGAVVAGCTPYCQHPSTVQDHPHASVLSKYGGFTKAFRQDHWTQFWWLPDLLDVRRVGDGGGTRNDIGLAFDPFTALDPATGLPIGSLQLGNGDLCPANVLRGISTLLEMHAAAYRHPLLWGDAIKVARQNFATTGIERQPVEAGPPPKLPFTGHAPENFVCTERGVVL